jgi:hypothetical protein
MDIQPNPKPKYDYLVTTNFLEVKVLQAAVAARVENAAAGKENLSEAEAYTLVRVLRFSTRELMSIGVNVNHLGYLATCLSAARDGCFSTPNEVRIARELASQFSIEQQVAEINLVLPNDSSEIPS